ncbi:MAG: RsmD family RNA methyltransferase [Acidobacteriota bacterium]
MRVIGGELRSRVLKSVPGLDTRPTPDRLREALFSILAPRIEEMVFADLYAGTGAVGIEAVSRGARRAIFAESDHKAAEVIRDNLRSLGIDGRCKLLEGKATAILKSLQADIVFFDPPYTLERDYSTMLTILGARPAGTIPQLVLAQHDKRLKLEETYGGLTKVRLLQQRDNCITFYAPTSTEP